MQGYEFDEEAFFRDSKARLKFDFTRHVPSVLEGFERYLELPERDRLLWMHDVEQMEHPSSVFDPDDGYIPRKGEKNVDPGKAAYDHKDVIHYSMRLPYILRSRDVPIEKHLPFLSSLRDLFDACVLGLLAVTQSIDRRAGTTTYASALRSTEHKLRVQRYKPEEAGKQIGKSHTDRSFLTIHLAETFPACYVEGELIEAKPDDALVFGSDGAYRGVGGKLPIRSCEHVIRVPPDSGWTNQCRYSIVFFGRIDR